MVSLVGQPLILFFSLLVLRLATASLTNRTIDDEKGDSTSRLLPEYSPPGAWHQGSTCTACYVHLDSSQTFRGTWHDTTYHPGDPEPRSITMRFNGTAVYVYNALANNVTNADTGTYLTFTLDGSLVGRYQHIPRSTTLFDYNIPVYANDSLQNEEHQLIVQADESVQKPSLILFDCAVYTFDDTPRVAATTVKTPEVSFWVLHYFRQFCLFCSYSVYPHYQRSNRIPPRKLVSLHSYRRQRLQLSAGSSGELPRYSLWSASRPSSASAAAAAAVARAFTFESSKRNLVGARSSQDCPYLEVNSVTLRRRQTL